MANTCIAPTPTSLNNRYEIIRIIEDGLWCVTWLAKDTLLPSHRLCIVRQVKPLTADVHIQKQFRDRLQSEINTWQKLGGIHDQIPWLSSFTDVSGQVYLIEEWVPGLTLSQALQKRRVFEEADVQKILAQLLSLVDYLHQNKVAHCVLEPNNIVLREENQKPVLQYGGMLNQVIANTFLANKIQPMPWLSTSFLPQEQTVFDDYSAASNLYSLGLIGIYLWTGKNPDDLDLDKVTSNEWQDILPEDSALAAILRKAITQFPGERFLTVREMMKAVANPSQFLQQSFASRSTLVEQMGAYINSCLLSLNPPKYPFNVSG